MVCLKFKASVKIEIKLKYTNSQVICGMIKKFVADVQIREIHDCSKKFTALFMNQWPLAVKIRWAPIIAVGR